MSTPIGVCFEGTRIDVLSEVPEVSRRLTRGFRWLLCPSDGTAAQTIRARTVGDALRAEDAAASVDSPDIAEVVRWIGFRIVEHFVDGRPDLVWIHAAGVSRDGGGLALPGRRGSGKSTLASALWTDGWDLLSDDVLPLDPATLEVRPFPQLPTYRQDPGRDLSAEELGLLPKVEVDVGERVAQGSTPLRALVFPFASRNGPATLRPWRPAEAALSLLEGCWNYATLKEGAVEALTRIVNEVEVLRVDFSEGAEAVDLVRTWVAERWG